VALRVLLAPEVLLFRACGGGGAATSGGACDARRSLTLEKLSRLEIKIIECLWGC
jgi:hypothetical protein